MDNELNLAAPDETDAEQITIKEPPALKRFFGTVRSALYGKKYLGFCFLIPAVLLFLVYLARGVWPNGEGSVLVLDLNGQYVYFFEALRDLITKGGSFLFSFRRALGGEFMGIFAYYLASPLSFIVALFPKENMTEAIEFLLVLKCGLCGFTFGYFAHKTRPRHPLTTVTFSVMWALSAYAVVMQHNLMWTDNIILFPLVLLGIQRIIKKGRMSLYVVTLALSILSNFYIGYMTCIFSGLYFFLCYASKNKEERNPDNVRFHFGKSFARFAAASVCAVCIGAVIILPTYYSLTLGKTTFSDPSFTPAMKFNLADFFTKFYFGSYDTVRPEGLPFLYTGTLTLLVAPVYFVCKKIAVREKVVSALTFVIFLLSMNITTLDLFWHGMQKPNWLNYRYAYMLCFFLLCWGMRAFEHIREINFRWVAGSFIATSGVLMILQKLEYDNLPDMRAIVPSLLIAFALLLIVLGVRSKKLHLETAARVGLVFFVCIEMVASALVNFNDLDDDVVFSGRTGYRNFLDRVSIAAKDIEEHDSSFYRAEKTFMRKSNDNMALGFRGLSGSTSTLNAETIKFLGRMGYASRSHWSKYFGETPVSDSLLGVKYIVAETNDKVYEAKAIFNYPDENMITYENPYALSVATAVDTMLTNAPFTDDGVTSPFERMNSLVSYMLGDPEAPHVFTESPVQLVTTDNVKESTIAGHIKYSKLNEDSTARVTYHLVIDSSDPLFCYFPSKYTRDCDLKVNGSSIGTYFENDTYRIYSLGEFDDGEEITVSLELKKSELYVESDVPYFYFLDTARYEEAFGELGKYPMSLTSDTDDTLTGTITVPEGKCQIFTSIPYDEGWVVTCDGNEVETTKVLDALLTFSLEPGEHEVKLEYRPVSVKYGKIISLMGLIAFVLISVSNHLLIKYSKKKSICRGGAARRGGRNRYGN